MPKRTVDAVTSKTFHSGGNPEVPLEQRQAEMACIAEEAEANEVAVSASTGPLIDPAENAASPDEDKHAADRKEQTKQFGPEEGAMSSAPNPFDPASFRLDQSFAETVGVKKLLTTVPVRRPNRQEFMRVHPSINYRLSPAAIIELKEDHEVYLLTPNMAQALPGEFVPVTLFTTINRQGVLSLWPVRLPGQDGRQLEWHRSAAEAAERAMSKWIRIAASMSLGAYEITEAIGDIPEPVWPAYSFQEILRIAFHGRIVDSPNHPLVRRLRGL